MSADRDPELEPLIAFAHELADAARAETLHRFRTHLRVEAKGAPASADAANIDPVTEADREAERVIRARIEARYPDHGIVGEEFGTVRGGAPYRWVLDPIDGTRAFICGTPSWTTLIALEHRGLPLLGLIDQPHIGERWVGARGRPTVMLRGSEPRVVRTKSSQTQLAGARISSTDPRATGYFTAAEAAAFERLAARAAVCRFSLDAYGYALLASGSLDLVVESGLAHYDYAALAPVIEGAGGVITDWRGRPFDADRGGRTLAAATPELHAAAMALLA